MKSFFNAIKCTGFVLFLTILPVSTILSETIILRNGKTVRGKVLGHDSESVTAVIDGETVTIPKTKIYKVIFSSNNTELKKFLTGKKKLPELQEPEEAGSVEKKEKEDLSVRLSQLEKKIGKLEGRISRIKRKIRFLRKKIRQRQAEEKKKRSKKSTKKESSFQESSR